MTKKKLAAVAPTKPVVEDEQEVTLSDEETEEVVVSDDEEQEEVDLDEDIDDDDEPEPDESEQKRDTPAMVDELDFVITEADPALKDTAVAVPPENRISKPFLFKYEKTRVVAARAQQLAQGAMPLVDPGATRMDPVAIAEEELRQKKTPFIIRRYMPSGHYEDWKIDELEDILLD